MMIDASAIVAILARRPEAEALLARLESARPPLLATPLALLEAVDGLARAKAAAGLPTPALLAGARAAVDEFAAALGLSVVPVTAELGRRAADLMATGDLSPGRALAAVAARAYRVPLLADG